MRAQKSISKRGTGRQGPRLESAADRATWEGGNTFDTERVGGHYRQGATV